MPPTPPSAANTRSQLQRAGSLHWFHWLVIALSLALTLFAWWLSSEQVNQRIQVRFEQDAQQTVRHIVERMQKYEDALAAGAAFIHASGGEVSHQTWRDYASRLGLRDKYPGINGIGVIHNLTAAQQPGYLAEQRRTRPDFRIHPAHSRDELMPITYIEPEQVNAAAVGLDMAHEDNRFTAAQLARRTGIPQITGPIVLVQDARQTPGFLFFVPFYGPATAAAAEPFRGLVYAPFVMRYLMLGTLDSRHRETSVEISDGSEVLFSDADLNAASYDHNPLQQTRISLPMYGRTWTFDIQSTLDFRTAYSSNQPLTILVGGLLVEVLLVGLFVLMAKANRKALRYADQANSDLRSKADALAASNRELEQFAYVASHDLQEPLRMVGTFSELLSDTYAEEFDDRGRKWLGYLSDGAARMQDLVRDLLDYSRSGAEHLDTGLVDTEQLVAKVVEDLGRQLSDTGGLIHVGDLPKVVADGAQLQLVFQNLLSNALKFHAPGGPGDDPSASTPVVHVSAGPGDSPGTVCFQIRDNGIGINPQHQQRVFEIFQRLHKRSDYPGTGIGLAVCMKAVLRHGGRMWLESAPGAGSTFYFTLPGSADHSLPGAGDPGGSSTEQDQAA